LAFQGGGFGFVDSQQVRNAGSVDVGVHQAGFRTKIIQSVGQARRDGAFADAPLAAADGDDVADVESESAAGVFSPDTGRKTHLDRLGESGIRLADCLFDGLGEPLPLGVGGRRQFDFDPDCSGRVNSD
jgi:hypothetical protein